MNADPPATHEARVKQITLSPRRVQLAVLTVIAGLLMAGCSGGGDATPATPAAGVAPPLRPSLPPIHRISRHTLSQYAM